MGYVVGSAEVELVPSAEGFDEKANALLGDLHVTVKLDADMLKLREELASIQDAHVKVKADTDLLGVRAELASIQDAHVQVKADVDTLGVRAELASIRDAHVKVKADTALAELEIDEVARERDAKINVSAPGAGPAQGALGGILTTVLALAPALIPLAGGLTAIALGLAAVTAAAGIGVGALAGVTIAALTVDKSLRDKLDPSLDKLEKSFDRFVGKNTGAILKPLQDGIHLVSSLLPSLTPLVRAASTAVDGLLKPLQALVDNGTFSRWASQIATLVGPAVSGFGKIVGNLTLGLGQMLAAYAPFGKTVLAGLVSMTGTFAKIGQSPEFKAFVAWSIAQVPLVTDVLHNLLGVAGGLLQVLAPWGQFVLSFIDALLGGAKGMSFFNDSLTNLQNHMPQFVSMVSGALTHIVQVVGAALPTIATALGGILGGVADAIAKALPKALPAIVIGLTKLVGALLAALPALTPPLIRLVDGLLSGLLQPVSQKLIPSLITNIGKSIIANGPAIGAALAALGPIFAKAGVDLWTNAWQKTFDGWGKNISHWFNTDLPSFINQALANIGQWLIQAGQNLLTGLVQGIVIGLALVRDLLFTWPAQFGSWLVRVVPTFLTGGQHAIEGLGRGIQTAWNAVGAWFAALPGRIGAFFAGAPQWLATRGIQVLTGLGNGITSGYKGVSSWFQSLPSRIAAFGAGAIGWLNSVGHNIVQGLLNGLSGAWGAVNSFVQNAISAIPASIRKILGIQSPSTVMAEIGGFMGQGLQVGLVGSLHDAMDAATTTLTSRTSDLALHATAAVQSQLDASMFGASGNDALQRIIAVLTQLLDKTPAARDLAAALRVANRTGGVTA